MNSTSPLPEAPSFLGQTANPIPVPVRSTHIPAFYAGNQHRDPENTVVRDGNLPVLGADKKPFVVAQVAEERRWAIHEDGSLMDQVEFAAKLADVRLEFYSMLRAQGRDAKFVGDIHLEPVPTVTRYVSKCVDPLDPSKLIQIGFDPNSTAGAVPDQLMDGTGEKAVSRMDALVDAYHSKTLRKTLKTTEIAEVEAFLGVESDAGTEGIASELESVTAEFAAGKLTDMEYAAKVRALTGAPKQTVEAPKKPASKKPEKNVVMIPALCGAQCRGKRGKRMHEMNCNQCKSLRGTEGG